MRHLLLITLMLAFLSTSVMAQKSSPKVSDLSARPFKTSFEISLNPYSSGFGQYWTRDNHHVFGYRAFTPLVFPVFVGASVDYRYYPKGRTSMHLEKWKVYPIFNLGVGGTYIILHGPDYGAFAYGGVGIEVTYKKFFFRPVINVGYFYGTSDDMDDLDFSDFSIMTGTLSMFNTSVGFRF
ncbi:hypothetical protein [Porphyromonas sp.]|uniref:hypothetical protein n=1 Tax=Porphyromonas sp. TaxID=1924944 RepID=UPI0026DC3E05|nr:hypothetical protein [Porphyromonas sp.]MDO4771570.1 hypothetical protein [Porphyromonas sp.]